MEDYTDKYVELIEKECHEAIATKKPQALAAAEKLVLIKMYRDIQMIKSDLTAMKTAFNNHGGNNS